MIDESERAFFAFDEDRDLSSSEDDWFDYDVLIGEEFCPHGLTEALLPQLNDGAAPPFCSFFFPPCVYSHITLLDPNR